MRHHANIDTYLFPYHNSEGEHNCASEINIIGTMTSHSEDKAHVSELFSLFTNISSNRACTTHSLSSMLMPAGILPLHLPKSRNELLPLHLKPKRNVALALKPNPRLHISPGFYDGCFHAPLCIPVPPFRRSDRRAHRRWRICTHPLHSLGIHSPQRRTQSYASRIPRTTQSQTRGS